jgi:photosystem II stability/assembly factor-like uncharacterized protein
MTTAHIAMRDCYRRVTFSDGESDSHGEIDPESVETHAADALDGRGLECVAVHPDAPERVFVGTFEAGLWRSTDGGETFERVGGDGITEDAVMSATVAPEDPAEVWVGTEPSRVFRSRDGGETWTELEGLTALDSAEEWSFPPRPHTHHVRWLEPDPGDPDHWYVAIEAGALVQTHDGGETWEDRVPDARIDNHSLATHADAPDRAWVAAGDGYAETSDGGSEWRHPQEGLDRTYCWSVAVDAGDPERVLVSAARSAREAHTAERAETYVYRRVGGAELDDETAWERLDGTGLPMGKGVTRPVLCRGDAGGEFYAVSNRGLFRTRDGGDSWTRVGMERPERFNRQTARGVATITS